MGWRPGGADDGVAQRIENVEPEYDSVGSFLFGVYRNYLASGDTAFLNDLWPAVRRSADWLLTSISSANGLGAADYSIWEETISGLQHNSWTQAWYVAGLWAVQVLAEIRGETEPVDWYAGGPASIQWPGTGTFLYPERP